jgi:hypothetical protein
MSQANIRRVLLLLFVAIVGLGVYLANHRENRTTEKKVTRIEAASPCLNYPQSKLCHRSFSRAIETITSDQVCALFAVIHVVPMDCREIAARQHRRSSSREVVPSTGNSPHSQPSPPSGGHKGTPRGTKQPPKSSAPPSHAKSPPGETDTQTPTSPGNSGNTPGAEHGVKACVEVAVSACIKAEALPLHP